MCMVLPLATWPVVRQCLSVSRWSISRNSCLVWRFLLAGLWCLFFCSAVVASFLWLRVLTRICFCWPRQFFAKQSFTSDFWSDYNLILLVLTGDINSVLIQLLALGLKHVSCIFLDLPPLGFTNSVLLNFKGMTVSNAERSCLSEWLKEIATARNSFQYCPSISIKF